MGVGGFKSDGQGFYNRVEVVLREMMPRGHLRVGRQAGKVALCTV